MGNAANTNATGLLAGIRVLESSMLLNGASTGMMLADLGAEVIKVESPHLGDYIRLLEVKDLHRQTNRGKRSIAIDLRHAGGQAIFHRLLETADVFLTNAVADRNDKLGIGYAQLSAAKPGIVYCQNTGFGASGPYASLPSHGQMMDSLAGAMPVELDEEGLTRPRRDHARRLGTLASAGEGTAAGAIYAAYHIAAALARQARTGQGAYIDISSAEAVLASAWVAATIALNTPAKAVWWQDEDNIRGLARYQSYQAGDGKFLLFCPEEQKFWHRFCDLVDRPDLKDRHAGEPLRRDLQAIFHTRPLAAWMEMAVAHSLPIGPVSHSIAEVRADPQFAARGMITQDPADDFVHIGQPGLVEGAPRPPPRPAPELGEHTDTVLAELGYDPEETAEFARQGVTTAAHAPRELYAQHSAR